MPLSKNLRPVGGAPSLPRGPGSSSPKARTVYVPPPPDAPGAGGPSAALSARMLNSGSIAADAVNRQTGVATSAPSTTSAAPDASTVLPAAQGATADGGGGAAPGDFGGAPDAGIDNTDYGQGDPSADMSLAEESASEDDATYTDSSDADADSSDADSSASMDGFDVLGAVIGADAGYSLPALWKVLNAAKPMTKAQADSFLAAGEAADRLAAKYLSGSNATKAQTHLDAMTNTRESVSNAADDPLSEGVASGVRTMTADAFTNANTFYNENQEGAAHLDALYSDLKDNAANLPGKVVTLIKDAGTAVANTVSSIGNVLKYVVIGGVVIVLGTAGVYIYRKVRT